MNQTPTTTTKGKLYITNIATPNNSKLVEVCHGVKFGNAQKVLGRRTQHNIIKAEFVIGKPGDFEKGKPASDNYQVISVELPGKYIPVPRLKSKKRRLHKKK